MFDILYIIYYYNFREKTSLNCLKIKDKMKNTMTRIESKVKNTKISESIISVLPISDRENEYIL